MLQVELRKWQWHLLWISEKRLSIATALFGIYIHVGMYIKIGKSNQTQRWYQCTYQFSKIMYVVIIYQSDYRDTEQNKQT